MKKITLLRTLLLGVVLTLSTAWVSAQQTVTYTYTAAAGDINGNATVFTLNGVDWNVNIEWANEGQTYFGYDSQNGRGLQLGSSKKPAKVVTLSTTGFVGEISKVVVHTAGTKATLDVTVGTTAFTTPSNVVSSKDSAMVYDGKAAGELKLVWNIPQKAMYIKSIEVTYEAPVDFVEKPAFSVADGTESYKAFDVELTTATQDAKIYYTTDGSTPDATKTEYTQAITVDKDVTIMAIAIKDGNVSEVESASYVVYTPVEHKDIAAFIAAKDKSRVSKIAGEVVITFIKDHDCFVQDASGAMQIRKGYNDEFDAKMVAGAKLTGVFGKYDEFNSNAQMAYEATTVPAIAEGNPVEPAVVTIDALTVPADLSKYVILKGVTLKGNVEFNSKEATNVTVEAGGMTIDVRNNFKIEVPAGKFVQGDVVDVIGIVSAYKGKVQLYFISMQKEETEAATQKVEINANVYSANGQLIVEAEEGAQIEVYSMLGQRVAALNATSTVSVIDVERGVVIVRVNGVATKVVVK